MKILLKELLWVIIFYLVVTTIKYTLFPLDHPKYHKMVFVNVAEDNYFITNLEVFITILILGYFIMYQIRTLVLKFKNQFSNYILIFWHTLSITLISVFMAFAFSFKNSISTSQDQTFYINDVSTDLNWNLIFYGLLTSQIAVSGFLIYNTIRITKVRLKN